MIKFYNKIFVLLFLFVNIICVCFANDYVDKKGNRISADIVTIFNKHEKIREGFIDSFGDAYKDVSLETLKVENKETFLYNAFQEEFDDFGQEGVYQIAVEDISGNLVAYFSFNNIDQRIKNNHQAREEFKDFPEKSAYIRQLYVAPSFQKRGIGSLLVNKVIYDFFPSLEHIYVATRRINEPARKLYESCVFKESDKNLHGLPQERYMSFERHERH